MDAFQTFIKPPKKSSASRQRIKPVRYQSFTLNEADYIDDSIKNEEHRFAKSFNLNLRYTYDVLSEHNPRFMDSIHRIYPKRTCEKGYYKQTEVIHVA